MINQYRWNGPMLAPTTWGNLSDAIGTLVSRNCGDIEARTVVGCRTCGETREEMRGGRCGGAPGSSHHWDDAPAPPARVWPIHATIDPHDPLSRAEHCMIEPWDSADTARLSYRVYADEGAPLPALHVRFFRSASLAHEDALERIAQRFPVSTQAMVT